MTGLFEKIVLLKVIIITKIWIIGLFLQISGDYG